MKGAGYSVEELARLISPLGGNRDFTILQNIVGVPGFQLNLWTTLFYAGFSIAELKTVGFRGELTSEEETGLERIQYRYINGFDPLKT